MGPGGADWGSGTEDDAGSGAAAGLPPLDPASLAAVAGVYDKLIRPQVHHRW